MTDMADPAAVLALLAGTTGKRMQDIEFAARAQYAVSHAASLDLDGTRLAITSVVAEARRLRKSEESLVRALAVALTEITRLRAAFGVFQPDGHQWSKRPCPTCRQITALIGFDFGCTLYAKQRTALHPAKGEANG